MYLTEKQNQSLEKYKYLFLNLNIQQQEYVTHETRDLPEGEQEKRKAWKVFTVKAWDTNRFGKATELSAEELSEDVPF